MSVWFKSRLNPWYIWIPSNPNLYSTKIIMKMRWQTIASNVSIRTISPTATPLPKAYDCVAVYIAGRRTSLVVYGWWATPVTYHNAPFKASFWDRARVKADRHIQPQHRPPSYAHVTRSQDKAVFTYCQNCGEDNHLTGQCKHRRTIECFHCGKSGHKDKFCSLYWSQGQKDWPSPISRASTFNLIFKDIGATNIYDVNVLESIVNSGDIWSYKRMQNAMTTGRWSLHFAFFYNIDPIPILERCKTWRWLFIVCNEIWVVCLCWCLCDKCWK